MVSVLFLQPPSPPCKDVFRDYAGGFGVALPSERDEYGHGPFSIPYVSLMYSAGIMSHRRWDIAYVDAQAERLDAESTLAAICKFRPDIVVSVVCLPSIYEDGRFLSRLKSRLPGTKIIGIGTVCRILPDILAKMNALDVAVLGESESVLPNLLENMREGGDMEAVPGIGIIEGARLSTTESSSELIDLESLPWPPYDIMPTSSYRMFNLKVRSLPVWASRGCPMPCSFYCPYPVGMGKSIRLRPVDDFVDEIAHLNRRFGIAAFGFRDQLFSWNQTRTEEICELLIAQRLKVRWMCETRFDMVNEDLLRKMKRAGCQRIHFGLETGDPEHLHRVGKPGMRLSTAKEAISLAKKVGIFPMTHLVIGLPGETRETVRRTFETIRDLGLTQISVNLATPYPGTPLHSLAKREGLLETENWSQYTSFDAVMRTKEMTLRELEASREFMAQNFLGSTMTERISYLCRNKEIVEAISRKSLQMWNSPSTILPFLKKLPHGLWSYGTKRDKRPPWERRCREQRTALDDS